MSMPTNVRTSVVTLSGLEDWVEWLDVVKSMAATGQVWVYVDPSKTQVPTLSEPRIPESRDINPTATTIQVYLKRSGLTYESNESSIGSTSPGMTATGTRWPSSNDTSNPQLLALMSTTNSNATQST